MGWRKGFVVVGGGLFAMASLIALHVGVYQPSWVFVLIRENEASASYLRLNYINLVLVF